MLEGALFDLAELSQIVPAKDRLELPLLGRREGRARCDALLRLAIEGTDAEVCEVATLLVTRAPVVTHPAPPAAWAGSGDGHGRLPTAAAETFVMLRC